MKDMVRFPHARILSHAERQAFDARLIAQVVAVLFLPFVLAIVMVFLGVSLTYTLPMVLLGPAAFAARLGFLLVTRCWRVTDAVSRMAATVSIGLDKVEVWPGADEHTLDLARTLRRRLFELTEQAAKSPQDDGPSLAALDVLRRDVKKVNKAIRRLDKARDQAAAELEALTRRESECATQEAVAEHVARMELEAALLHPSGVPALDASERA